MTRTEFWSGLFDIQFNARFSHRYHQLMQRRHTLWDVRARLFVMLLAILSLCTCYPELPSGWAIAVSLTGLVAAVWLNISPYGDYSRDAGLMAKRWADLETQAIDLRDQYLIDGSEGVAKLLVHRLLQLRAHESHLHSEESPPDEKQMEIAKKIVELQFFGSLRDSASISTNQSQRIDRTEPQTPDSPTATFHPVDESTLDQAESKSEASPAEGSVRPL